MYCGHCGAAVEEHDQFCRSCGARFVEPASTSALATGATSVSAFGVDDPAVAPIGAVEAPPPTELIPVVQGSGERGARPFLIGVAFALIVAAGIVAFFVLR